MVFTRGWCGFWFKSESCRSLNLKSRAWVELFRTCAVSHDNEVLQVWTKRRGFRRRSYPSQNLNQTPCEVSEREDICPPASSCTRDSAVAPSRVRWRLVFMALPQSSRKPGSSNSSSARSVILLLHAVLMIAAGLMAALAILLRPALAEGSAGFEACSCMMADPEIDALRLCRLSVSNSIVRSSRLSSSLSLVASAGLLPRALPDWEGVALMLVWLFSLLAARVAGALAQLVAVTFGSAGLLVSSLGVALGTFSLFALFAASLLTSREGRTLFSGFCCCEAMSRGRVLFVGTRGRVLGFLSSACFSRFCCLFFFISSWPDREGKPS